MPSQPFIFNVRLTPSGKCFVELYEGLVKVGVSRKTYSSAEMALSDMRAALEHSKLADALVCSQNKSKRSTYDYSNSR